MVPADRISHVGASAGEHRSLHGSHAEVAQQLSKNPALVDNPKYVANHPGLHEYLQNHPTARCDWKSHPYRYMAAERHYDQKH